MLLEAKRITKKFGDLTVLDEVSLAFSAGEFVSIVGKSGSGKSTLLTILGGIDRPTEGEVLLNGKNISKQKERELAKLRRTELGFVFQFFNLAPYLTARENILLPIVLNGNTEKSAERKLRELTQYLGVSELLDKLPAKLSGGEQQRVAIARGLIFEPELILLDEPTGNLDSRSSEEIMRLLLRINRDTGTTVVQVTHSARNAAYGSRIVEIVDGRIASDRRAEDADFLAFGDGAEEFGIGSGETGTIRAKEAKYKAADPSSYENDGEPNAPKPLFYGGGTPGSVSGSARKRGALGAGGGAGKDADR